AGIVILAVMLLDYKGGAKPQQATDIEEIGDDETSPKPAET
ncbi:MAG: EamA family transporter, partial [Thalassospira sp.]|nr:EamA family transporter [Thalassospira sp.]